MEGRSGQTEKATSKRRGDERRKGNLPLSQEVISVLVLLAGVILLRVSFPAYLGGTARLLELSCLTMAHGEPWSGLWLQQHYWTGLLAVLQVTAPLFVGIMLAGTVGSVAQTGPYFSWQAFESGGLKALNPIKGAKRMFSLKSVTTLLMTLAKIGLIACVILLLWRRRLMAIVQLPDFDLVPALIWMGRNIYGTVMAVVVLAIALAAIDVVVTRRRHERGMMMTKQEVKDERKQYEVKPEVKRAQAKKMRALTLSRLVSEVPKSTVIITNPIRFAIALRYNPDEMDAPVVLAKGMRLRARKIRELAEAHGIPIVERPPLARALYRSVAVGRAIPAHLFEAVAEVLAYLHRLGHRLEGVSGGGRQHDG